MKTPLWPKAVVATLVIGFALTLPLRSAVSLEDCSGEVEKKGKCTTERACDITTNADCLEKIVATDHDHCATGLPADNCVKTAAEFVCADRIACEPNATGTQCITGAMLGTVIDHFPTDGGSCNIKKKT